jgi:hypothetical protein
MSDPKPDPVVKALVPDPAVVPPSVAVLTGYLGQSTAPDRWRLYLTPALDCYVDISADKILHTSQSPGTQGTRVWVPRNLELEYTRIISVEVQAGFLQGSIVGRHLPASSPAGAAGLGQPGSRMFARDDWPPSVFFDCFTDEHCHTPHESCEK